MPEITRYPLCWPNNVPRVAPASRTRPQFAERTIASAVQFVLAEINRLNGRPWDFEDDTRIISTNVRPNKEGLPRGDQPAPTDPGAAAYFTLHFKINGKPHERPCVLTCDKWTRVEWNLCAIGKDIEAQRGRSRWGCGTVQQAFQGYLAIPERCGSRAWWDVLEIKPDAGKAEIEAARNRLGVVKKMHPDKGGSHDGWVEIQNAFEQAMARFR